MIEYYDLSILLYIDLPPYLLPLPCPSLPSSSQSWNESDGNEVHDLINSATTWGLQLHLVVKETHPFQVLTWSLSNLKMPILILSGRVGFNPWDMHRNEVICFPWNNFPYATYVLWNVGIILAALFCTDWKCPSTRNTRYKVSTCNTSITNLNFPVLHEKVRKMSFEKKTNGLYDSVVQKTFYDSQRTKKLNRSERHTVNGNGSPYCVCVVPFLF